MERRPQGAGDPAPRPAVRSRPGLRRIDAAVGFLVRLGLVPGTYLLTTVGRRTGRPLTHPVTLVERHGRRWLVSPYGQVSWVRNARACARVALERRGRTEQYDVREVSAREAAPVLKAYLALTGPPRRYFRADKDAPVADFAAEAADHPVFELLPLE